MRNGNTHKKNAYTVYEYPFSTITSNGMCAENYTGLENNSEI